MISKYDSRLTEVEMIQSEDLSMQFFLVGRSHGPLFMSTYTVATFWELPARCNKDQPGNPP